MVDRGDIGLLFGLNHHILGDQAKCPMLLDQVAEREGERERERDGKMTVTEKKQG